MTAFPATQWRELLDALCSDDVSSIGTVAADEPLARIEPTRFDWLTGLAWRPAAGNDFGIAILDLAEPGAHPAGDWEQVCGPLVAGAVTPGADPLLQGLYQPPGAPHRAAVYLTVHRNDTTVTGVMIRIEP